MNLDSIICSKEEIKKCLYEMIKNQTKAPKMIILQGQDGSGRKSLARNYVKSIFCNDKTESYSNCGVCSICNNILNSEVYYEIDYSEIDNIVYHDFIVITNFEDCPRQSQTKLLDWWNNQQTKPTIIYITKSTDNIIDSIYDLSLILRVPGLTEVDILNILYYKIKSLNIDISKDNLDLIATRSRGNANIALKMLEKFQLLDNETFKQSMMSARELFIVFLISCYRDNKEDVDKYIGKLKCIPLAYLKVDYESLILEIIKTSIKFEKPKDKLISLLINEIKTKVLDLYYILNDKIIYNSFTNDDAFQSAMYVIYLKINNRIR